MLYKMVNLIYLDKMSTFHDIGLNRGSGSSPSFSNSPFKFFLNILMACSFASQQLKIPIYEHITTYQVEEKGK